MCPLSHVLGTIGADPGEVVEPTQAEPGWGTQFGEVLKVRVGTRRNPTSQKRDVGHPAARCQPAAPQKPPPVSLCHKHHLHLIQVVLHRPVECTRLIAQVD
jgi:hypothetical protein